MKLKLSLTKDKRGFHLTDVISSTSLHWQTEDDVRDYLKQSDGEPLEQALRAALREIVQQQDKTGGRLDAADVSEKDFTFQPAKAVTAWP